MTEVGTMHKVTRKMENRRFIVKDFSFKTFTTRFFSNFPTLIVSLGAVAAANLSFQVQAAGPGRPDSESASRIPQLLPLLP